MTQYIIIRIVIIIIAVLSGAAISSLIITWMNKKKKPDFKLSAADRIRFYISFVMAGLVMGFVAYYIFFIMLPPSEDPSVHITISTPSDGDSVQSPVRVSGTVKNHDDNDYLWILLLPEKAQRYYPQTGPLNVDTNNQWAGEVYFGGKEESSPQQNYVIFVAVANKAGNTLLTNYMEQSKKIRSYEGVFPLPGSITRIASIRVTR